MNFSVLLLVLLGLSTMAYVVGTRRAVTVAGGPRQVRTLHSRPTYYGVLTAIWCGLPAVLVLGLWLAFEDAIITNLVVSSMPAE